MKYRMVSVWHIWHGSRPGPVLQRATSSRVATLLLVSLALPVILGGCVTATVGSAAVGVAALHDRRTAGAILEDQSIELAAGAAIRRDKALADQVHVNFTAFNRLLLITGQVPDEALRQRVYEAVKSVPNVRRVYNETTLSAPSAVLSRASDSYVTSKVKSKFILEEQLDPTRVKVVTEDGTVFLMGIVTAREADLATEIARNTSGAQKVVKLFELCTDACRPRGAPRRPQADTREL